MKRSSSRNKENNSNMAQFNLTAGTKYSNQAQQFSRQIGQSDLTKVSSMHKNELHELVNDLDRPNESLSLSSFSQSPNLIRTRGPAAYQNTEEFSSNKHYSSAHGIGDTLGRSEISEDLISKSGDGGKDLSLTGRGINDFQRKNKIQMNNRDTDLNSDFDDEEDFEHEEIKYEKVKKNQRSKKILKDIQDELLEDGDEEEEQKYQDQDFDRSMMRSEQQQDMQHNERMNESAYNTCGKDSPDFNRNQIQEEDEDLTISNNTQISNLNISYKLNNKSNISNTMGQKKAYVTNNEKQSRTFADSVLQGNQLMNKSNIGKGGLGDGVVTQRDKGGFGGQKRGGQTADEAMIVMTSEDGMGNGVGTDEDHSMEEDYYRQGDKNDDDSRLDSSDISGVDSFAQTQRSRLSKLPYNKQQMQRQKRIHQEDQNNISDDQSLSQNTRRSPNPPHSQFGNRVSGLGVSQRPYENGEQDESLNLTVSSQERRDLSQRSNIAHNANNKSQSQNNRTVNSDQATQNANNYFGINNSMNQQNQFNNRLTTDLQTLLQNKNYNETTVMREGAGVERQNSRHNRSLQKDSELEAVLEQQVSKQVMQPVKQSKKAVVSQDESYFNDTEFKKLRIEISQLKIANGQLNKNVQHMDGAIIEKDKEISELILAKDELKIKLTESTDTLQILRGKDKRSGSQGRDVKETMLDKARQENKHLSKELKLKEITIKQLQGQISKMQQEDRGHNEVFNQHFNSQIEEIQKLKIMIQSHKKQIESQGKEKQQIISQQTMGIQQVQYEYEQKFNQLLQENQQLNNAFPQFQHQIKDLESIIKTKDHELSKIQKEMQKYGKVIDSSNKEKNKFQDELTSYKERCKDLEQEIEQTRQENTSIFGNQTNKSTMFLNNKSVLGGSTSNNNEYEIKKMRDMLSEKLNKEKEMSSKWKQKYEETDLKLIRFREETQMKLSEQSILEKVQQDQELMRELDRCRAQVNNLQLLETKIRECFKIEEKEDIGCKMLELSSQLELGKYYQSEYQKCQSQLMEMQNSQKQMLLKKDSQGVNNNSLVTENKEMSQFRMNMILQKDKQIEQLQYQLKSEQNEKEKLENELFEANRLVNSQQKELQGCYEQIEVQDGSLTKMNELKEKTDANIEELKGQLREKLKENKNLELLNRELQEQVVQHQLQQDKYIEKGIYQELVNQVLKLNLVKDPLSDENIILQQSFINEHEQALKHLEEQKILLKDHIDSQSRSNQISYSQLEAKLQSQHDKLAQYESLKKENLSLIEQIRDLDKQIEVNSCEFNQLKSEYEKLCQLLKETENTCAQLRKQKDETNTDMKKLMRSQEQLLNGSNIMKQKEKIIPNNSQETERLVMVYEDQLSRAQQQIDKLQKQVKSSTQQSILPLFTKSTESESQLKEKHQREFLETFDKLIDLKQSFSPFNDFAHQLKTRIDKIKSQEQQIFLQNQKMNPMKASQRSKSSENKENMKHALNEQQPKPQSFIKVMNQSNTEELMSNRMDDNQHEKNSDIIEDDFVWSVAKLLKQSQSKLTTNIQDGNEKNTQNQFKNFFQNEDNTSLLLLSELITQHQQPAQLQHNQIDHQQQQLVAEMSTKIKSLEQAIEEKGTIIKIQENQLNLYLQEKEELQGNWSCETKEIYEQLESKCQLLEEQKQKMMSYQKEINQREYESVLKNKDIDIEKQKDHQQKALSEVQQFKDQVKRELIEKTQLIEQEYQSIDDLKHQIKDEYEKKVKALEERYNLKINQQEKEYRDKLLEMEKNIRNGCENELIERIQKEIEEQWERKVKDLKEESNQQVAQMKEEWLKEKEDAKKAKERELKKSKDDSDKLKKTFEDKIKSLELDKQSDKDKFDAEAKTSSEQLLGKNKKQVEKVKAEMRNQIDAVKNEGIKQKAEFEREKKRIQQEHQSLTDKLKSDFDETLNTQLKQERDKQQIAYKKKLSTLEQDHQRKLEQLEQDMHGLLNSNKQDLLKEKERTMLVYKEQAKIEVRMEVTEDVEQEFLEQIEKIKVIQKEELDKIREKYEMLLREEKAAQIPKLKQFAEAELKRSSKRKDQDIQCELITECQHNEDDQFEARHHNIIDMSYPLSYQQEEQQQLRQNNSMNQMNQSLITQVTTSQAFIEQLKFNFEEELERQQKIFEYQLMQKQIASVKTFEDVVVLELDKILQSIYFKKESSQPVKSKQQQYQRESQKAFDIRRKEISRVVQDILERSDDRKEGQMKSSLDIIKRKISEILKEFKTELESKFSRRQAEQCNQSKPTQSHNNSSDNNISQHSQTVNVDQSIQSDSFSQFNPSKPPTPQKQQQNTQKSNQQQRTILSRENSQQRMAQPTPTMTTTINLNNLNNAVNPTCATHRSDIKQYIEMADEEDDSLLINPSNNDNCFRDNILRKITPVPNQRGVMVVEVSKIVRDLKMLEQTIKQAKFYRVIMNIGEAASNEESKNSNEALSGQEADVQNYRQLLNGFFKMVLKLNTGIESIGKAEEIYKLKLINSDLQIQLNKLKQIQEKQDSQTQIDEIINYYNSSKHSLLTNDSQLVLQKLESIQFQMNKLQFQSYQLKDNFTYQVSQDEQVLELIDQNSLAVNKKCKEFVNQNQDIFTDSEEQNKMLNSEYSPDLQKSQLKLCPEMLSPQETASLIASVFQKLNQANTNEFTINSNPLLAQTNQQNQFETCQSFFQTFMSNEEYVRSAENFIRKYREHKELNQTARTHSQQNNQRNKHNMPLQMVMSTDNIKTVQMSTGMHQPTRSGQSRGNYSQYGSSQSQQQIGNYTPKSNNTYHQQQQQF